MKVSVVCYEDPDRWILGKFAKGLVAAVGASGMDARLVREPDPTADINHHIIYIDRRPASVGIETMMVTHVDSVGRARLIEDQLRVVKAGVCMSRQTAAELIACGSPPNRLCSIPPPHDGRIRPRRLRLGVTSKVHDDGRKREWMIPELAERLDPASFSFVIMGAGWDRIVDRLQRLGFTIEYHREFDLATYEHLMPTLDAYLYMGEDEGSMGFLDALAAGVPTIVTPQGFHLDVPGGIDFAIRGVDDMAEACARLDAERRRRSASVRGMSWADYGNAHIMLWRRLLAGGDAADGNGSTQIDRFGLLRRLLAGSLRDRWRAWRMHG